MKLINPENFIKTSRLQLEPILPHHASFLYSSLQARELYTFIPHNPPASLEQLEIKYSNWSKRKSPTGNELWLNYAAYCFEKASYVGTVQATITLLEKTYIAYETFPPFWRQRFAKEACEALIALLFNGYMIKVVSALIDTRNHASCRLIESLGFRRTRLIKNADLFKGSSSDEYLYELTVSEWKMMESGRFKIEI